MIKTKNPRRGGQGQLACDISNIKKQFSRQASALDLNLSVDAEEEEEEAAKPASQTSSGCVERLLDSIKNPFGFNVLSKEYIAKFFVAKIKESCNRKRDSSLPWSWS